MDVKGNAGSLTSAIADSEITAAVSEMAQDFEKQATLLIKNFTGTPPTPQQAHSIESQLGEKLSELGRRLIEWLFSHLEPAIEEMPAPSRIVRKLTGGCPTERFARISSPGSERSRCSVPDIGAAERAG